MRYHLSYPRVTRDQRREQNRAWGWTHFRATTFRIHAKDMPPFRAFSFWEESKTMWFTNSQSKSKIYKAKPNNDTEISCGSKYRIYTKTKSTRPDPKLQNHRYFKLQNSTSKHQTTKYQPNQNPDILLGRVASIKRRKTEIIAYDQSRIN